LVHQSPVTLRRELAPSNSGFMGATLDAFDYQRTSHQSSNNLSRINLDCSL
jgi:hypothetical protein